MEQRGTLKSWNDQKGFGFIRPEQGGEDVFAHISAVHGERRPLVGDRVLYVSGRDPQGRLRAEHLRLDAPLTLVYRTADAVGPAAHFLKIARDTARKAQARSRRGRPA